MVDKKWPCVRIGSGIFVNGVRVTCYHCKHYKVAVTDDPCNQCFDAMYYGGDPKHISFAPLNPVWLRHAQETMKRYGPIYRQMRRDLRSSDKSGVIFDDLRYQMEDVELVSVTREYPYKEK